MKHNKQFEGWLIAYGDDKDYSFGEDREGIPITVGDVITYEFKNLPLTMQWGIYLEYFSNVGIYLSTTCWKASERYSFDILMDNGEIIISPSYGTKQEMQEAAIKKSFIRIT